jgi:hypothetical protein
MPDDLQPGNEGQGDASTGIFDPYLQAVPEDARETVASYLKDAEKNVNGRLAEAAELQKTFGAFKDVEGLTTYDPADLSQLIAWHQSVTANPDVYKEWLSREAQEAGLTQAEEQELQEAEETGELTREQVQQLIQDTAEQRLAPIEEQFSALQAEKAVDTEATAIDSAFDQIQSEFKLELNKDQKAVILDLGMPLAYDEKGNELPMGDSSWVRKGFDRWKEVTDTGARLFIEQKANQPGTPLNAGGTPAAPPITSFGDANAALRERLRQAT